MGKEICNSIPLVFTEGSDKKKPTWMRLSCFQGGKKVDEFDGCSISSQILGNKHKLDIGDNTGEIKGVCKDLTSNSFDQAVEAVKQPHRA